MTRYPMVLPCLFSLYLPSRVLAHFGMLIPEDDYPNELK